MLTILHNNYRSNQISGEDLTVHQIFEILGNLKEPVKLFESFSDDLFKNSMNSFKTIAKEYIPVVDTDLRRLLEETDSLQVHNSFPIVSAGARKIIRRREIPYTRVVHNYRRSCLNGSHFRNAQGCDVCKKRNNFNFGYLNKCYQNNHVKSLIIGHHTNEIVKLESDLNSTYIAISKEIQNYLLDLGVQAQKIHYIPNAINALKTISYDSNQVMFIGRIEPEKGVKILVDFWRRNRDLPPLNIIGEGSILSDLRGQCHGSTNIFFHGNLQGDALDSVASQCKVIISPAIWAEPFGRTIVEGFARGQFVLSTKQGVAKDLLTSSDYFQTLRLNDESLRENVSLALEADISVQIQRSQSLWSKQFSPEAVSNLWLDFYSKR